MIPRITAFLGNILRQPVLKRIMEHTEPTKRPRSPSPQQAEAPEAKRPHIEPAPVSAAVQVDAEEAMFNVEEEIQSGKGRSGKRGNGGQARKEKKEKRDAKDPRAQRAWEPREKTDGEKRLPKRRCAVLIGYCGTGYQGMQIQDHTDRTIEGEIFAALVKAGAVSADNAVDARKVDIARAARTDAGVHAAGNVISIKMITEPPLPEGFKNVAEYVNTFLPDQIRMWGWVRTVKSFNARTAADSRIYEYLLPSYCLIPPHKDDPLAKHLDISSPDWREIVGEYPCSFADGRLPMPTSDEGEVDPKVRGEYERKRKWRVDERTLNRFRDIIAQYKGTHNFYNYTVGKPFNDRAVKRFMIQLEVKEPKVYGEIEWISVQIHGQSFMLHQIRKMISMAMLACRTGSPPSLLPETFGPKKIHIPKAPPLGLLLEAPQFGVYNDRITQKLNGITEDRDPVNFGLYADEIYAFKVKWIYEMLRKEELEKNVFHKWIQMMDNIKNDSLGYLNSKGVIPAEATALVLEQESKRREGQKAQKEGVEAGAEEIESDDEEVDQEALKRGDLEG
ncbi:tRNA pseudouridine(38-40) synthase [Cryptococcus gattii Ru294]|nr:tRNA pseudouridine(38-40) synthase [Cryptococcus gattii Ru294]